MNANLYERLAGSVDHGERTAVEMPDGERYSYLDLVELSARIANVLVARGVKPGDRVAVKVEKSFAALVLYLATLRAGAIYLPLNIAYTIAETDYFLCDAEPSLVVCDPREEQEVGLVAARIAASVETLDGTGNGSLSEAASSASPYFASVQRAPDDLAAILYTSGTTGRSKGAMLTHDNLLSNAVSLRKEWRFTSDDRLIHALPIYHTHGLFVASNVTLMSGGTLLLLPKFDADQIVRLMRNATVLMGVPTFYVRLLQHPQLGREAVGNIRLFVSGSAPLLAETHREWMARTGHAILERYGMTETNMITSNPYKGARVPGSVGLPLPAVSVRVTNPDTGAELPKGEIGMIEVRGPNVFKGYWQMPEKTAAEVRADVFFVTVDLGKFDEHGYLHIVGRGKDLIISGGFNVYPKEVESEIDAIPGVLESAVIGIPDADFGEAVTAVAIKQANVAIGEAEVLQALKHRLAKYKLPKRVYFVDELPRNAMGKVQKNLLRKRFAPEVSVEDQAV